MSHVYAQVCMSGREIADHIICPSKSVSSMGMGGKDVKVLVELSFMEAVQGCTKTLTFQSDLPCEACGGAGVPPGTRPETCQTCRGSGMINKVTGPFRVQVTCSYCHGTGKIVKNFCKSCNGEKIVRGPKTVKLDIMPDVFKKCPNTPLLFETEIVL
ncbi:hypothetical protein CsSME_00024608 [Camellia sinensis var. sinensis]